MKKNFLSIREWNHQFGWPRCEVRANLKDECFFSIIIICSNTGMEKAGSWVFPGLKFFQEIEQELRNKAINESAESGYNEEWMLRWIQWD